ncbi:hypothetical protein HO173_005776 [Letharia columbiana]|uniref:Uncharacterized protein n=1 Tax=Letharia columbiana TaxID=112416 RepID=A0A8H6FWR1_9LECA|nr:uncharacterized protein HO173_005776 [Letharia columbiana]KAF6236147.1 hypothetical protein HO173_005776 [Letharia columbiana]
MVPLLLLPYVLRIVIKKSVNNRKISIPSRNYAPKISYNSREINKIQPSRNYAPKISYNFREINRIQPSRNYTPKISYNSREINKIHGNVEIPHSTT